MADWHSTLLESELTLTGIHPTQAGKTPVILMRVKDEVVAFRDACPHEGYPLSRVGERDGDVLICTKHLWEFDGCSGRHVSRLERPDCNLVRFPVRVQTGRIEVDTDVNAPEVRRPVGVAI
ncbi:MAG: hypothetical protein RI949_521 [Pseudomonadota bacterium]|jgi:nitrite reductase/ring-hydroxylating ferredoxin subunit